MWGPMDVGIDLADGGAMVCEVHKKGARIALGRLGFAPLPPGADQEACSGALKQALAQAGIKKGKVTCSLVGAKRAILRTITLPLMDDAELAEQMGWEVEQHLPLPLDEMEYHYHVVERRPASSDMDVAVVAAKKDDIEEVRTILASAKLRPRGIEPAILGAYRFLQLTGRAQEPIPECALVELGAERTTAALFRGGMPLRLGQTATGGNLITQAIQSSLGVSWTEAEAAKKDAQPANYKGASYRSMSREELLRSCIADAVATLAQRTLTLLEPLTTEWGRNQSGQVHLYGSAAALPGLREQLMGQRPRMRFELIAFPGSIAIKGPVDQAQLRELAPALPGCIGLAL